LGKISKIQMPPVFMGSPRLPRWCATTGKGRSVYYLRGLIREDGIVVDLQANNPSRIVPTEIAADIGGWRFEPAKDAAGNPVAAFIQIEVWRGIPRSDPPSVCE
jgi:hypothetical protein